MALTDAHGPSSYNKEAGIEGVGSGPSSYTKEADIEGGGSGPSAAKARDRFSTHNYQRNSVTMLATAFGSEFPPAAMAPAPAPALRKFGDPAPLGLCAFALTTFLLSLVNFKAAGMTKMNVVVGVFYAYGGVVQLLAGMWEMAIGNTFAATAFASYGGFWISLAMIDMSGSPNSYGIVEAYGDNQKELNTALGFYLLVWFVFTTMCLLCTLKSTVTFFSMFFFLDLTFLLLAISHFQTGGDGAVNIPIQKAGGIAGLISATLGWWNALAGMVDQENSFITVPVGPFPWSEAGKAERKEYRGD